MESNLLINHPASLDTVTRLEEETVMHAAPYIPEHPCTWAHPSKSLYICAVRIPVHTSTSAHDNKGRMLTNKYTYEGRSAG